MLSNCMYAPMPCCSKDADCTLAGKSDPRCLPLFDVVKNFCGGAVPTGNVCRYDECSVDSDCVAGKPAGDTVATCLPSGAPASGAVNAPLLYNSTCVYGICRTNADFTLHPGGRCLYGLAATHGMSNLNYVLFCAYPSDPCQIASNGSTTGCAPPSPSFCVPNDNLQGRTCGQGPPAYP
jgi:hypothetical protein